MAEQADLSTPSVQASSRKPPEALADNEDRRIGRLTLCGLGLLIGIIGGLGAVVFRDLIGQRRQPELRQPKRRQVAE